MDIRIRYSREEIEEIILEHHVKKFGLAPDGEKWECSGGGYSGYEVDNTKCEEPTETETPKEGL